MLTHDGRRSKAPIHIRKLLDVEASLSGCVFSEFCQEGFRLAVVQHAVQNKAGLRGE
jgi:hypothetical protein